MNLISYILFILISIFLFSLLSNCQCIERFNISNQNTKDKIKSSIKLQHHHDPKYANLIDQVIKVKKHNVDEVRKENIKKGVSSNHPFASLSSDHVNLFLAYPNTIKFKNTGTNKKNIEQFTIGGPDNTADIINHEAGLGEVRNQGLIGNCWGIAIVEAIDSAYYNNSSTTRPFRASIQQLMDCLVDLVEVVTYEDIYSMGRQPFFDSTHPGGRLISTIENFYFNKKIYSESEYPSILEHCYIQYSSEQSRLIFCSDSQAKDICNDSDTCQSFNQRWSTSSAGPMSQPVVSDYSCTTNINNKCIQPCQTSILSPPSQTIIVSSTDFKRNVTDDYIYQKLLGKGKISGKVLICHIYVRDFMFHLGRDDCYIIFEDDPNTNRDPKDPRDSSDPRDPNLFLSPDWDPDNIQSWGSSQLKEDSIIIDLNKRNCAQYRARQVAPGLEEQLRSDPRWCWGGIQLDDDPKTDDDESACKDINQGAGGIVRQLDLLEGIKEGSIPLSALGAPGISDKNFDINYTCNDKYFGISGSFCKTYIDTIDGKVYRRDINNHDPNCFFGDPVTTNLKWKKTSEFCKDICSIPFYMANHVVIIIGSVYKANKDLPENKRSQTSGGRYFWKIRNSWGSEWGDNGHFYIERDVDDVRFKGDVSLLSIYSLIVDIELDIK